MSDFDVFFAADFKSISDFYYHVEFSLYRPVDFFAILMNLTIKFNLLSDLGPPFFFCLQMTEF